MKVKVSSRSVPSLFTVLVVALLLVVTGTGRASAGSSVLIAGTWNMHRFGHPSVPRSSADLANIASLIASRGLSVLAVQEVVVTRLGPAGEARSYAMDELVAILADEHGQIWGYWLHRGKGDLQSGFMWRTDLVGLDVAPLTGLGAKKVDCVLTDKKGKTKKVKAEPLDHLPVMAHVSTGDGLTDFTLINLHLREAEQVWGKGSFWEARNEAARVLAAFLESMYAPEKPGPAKPVQKKGNATKKVTTPAPIFTGPFIGPAFKLGGVATQWSSMADVKSVLGKVDSDLAILGTLNAAVDPARDLAPLMEMGLHLLGTSEPTHAGGDPLAGVLLSVPMGEEHALGADQVLDGQDLVVTPCTGSGMSPHHLVSFTVIVRPDDD